MSSITLPPSLLTSPIPPPVAVAGTSSTTTITTDPTATAVAAPPPYTPIDPKIRRVLLLPVFAAGLLLILCGIVVILQFDDGVSETLKARLKDIIPYLAIFLSFAVSLSVIYILWQRWKTNNKWREQITPRIQASMLASAEAGEIGNFVQSAPPPSYVSSTSNVTTPPSQFSTGQV